MKTGNVSAVEGLRRLQEGNQRFASNVRSIAALASQQHRADLVHGQAPFAVVLGCSDSRAPAELVFDQGLGDLFVIRVAGNIVAPSQVGSVEFAVERFGIRLVVVMGHTGCGAIGATLEAMEHPDEPQSRNLLSIVDRIRPSLAPLVEDSSVSVDRKMLERRAVRANVRASSDHLRHGSRILEQMALNDGLVVIGSVYDLESGVVDFFDGVP
ncbi:MAG TPA: carbonic anhydrase [Polyangiaceae bacterium]|nr:carbonic anhydrase [Polyangiaceae bacterium]